MGQNMCIVSQLGQKNMHIVSQWKQECQLMVLRDHVKRADPGSNLVTVVPKATPNKIIVSRPPPAPLSKAA